MVHSKNKILANNGQSLIEVILALAVFSLLSAAAVSIAAGSFEGLRRGGEQLQAESLAQESIEAVWSIHDRAWNELVYTTSSAAIIGNQWTFSGEGSTENIGPFTRTVKFSDVCRDAAHEIVICPGDYTDAHAKLVQVFISWEVRPGSWNTVSQSAYVTNWASLDWPEQVLSDFNDGVFEETIVSTLGLGDGSLTLEETLVLAYSWLEDTLSDLLDGTFYLTQTSTLGDGDGAIVLADLGTPVSVWTEDTSTDFNDGTFNDTAASVLGDGDGSVVLRQL